MIGDLLRELGRALRQFLRYHVSRLTGSKSVPAAQVFTEVPSPNFAVADANRIARLPDMEILSGNYRRPTRLSTNRRDRESVAFKLNPVFQIWQKHTPRAHKWTHYFEAYHSVFGSRRPDPLRILEIGVYQGASLRLWRQYFENPETIIVAIDIDSACARFDSPQEKIHVRIGSQEDAVFLSTVNRDFGPFDIIIDDGSHHSGHMIKSFNHLFAGALRDDGIYLAEDLHANYWFPWRDTQKSFLDLCKELMDLMHAHYTCATLDKWLQESDSGNEVALDVPAVAAMIKEIRIFDSIAAIYKTRREYLPRVLNPLAD